MKYIQKGSTPQELRRWFEGQLLPDGQRINCGYGDMPSDVRAVVKQRLLEEQGGLCCYTGMRVNSENSHIEHFKPQSACIEYEDVDYRNLLAAYHGISKRCQFGAHAKDDWYDENLLVSPLHQSCETKFRFKQSGEIAPSDNEDAAAVETIRRLRLDDQSLEENRQSAIDEALSPDNRRLRETQIRRLIEGLYSRNSDGNLPAFCFVIKDAAQDLLRKAEQGRRRRQAIRNQARS